MNPCTRYLHPGPPNADCCEQIADVFLTLPRCLWLDREVTIEKQVDKWEASYNSPGCGHGDLCCPRKIPGQDTHFNEGIPMIFVLALQFFFAQVPAACCASIGIPCKIIALETSEKSSSYSSMVENYLKKDVLENSSSIKCADWDMQYVGEKGLLINSNPQHSLDDVRARIEEQRLAYLRAD